MTAPPPGASTPTTGAPAPGAPVPALDGARPDGPTPTLTPYALRCEQRTRPLGVDEPEPTLSWRLASDRRGDAPVAHRVVVEALAPDGTVAGVVWDSGRVEDDAVSAVYAGVPLQPRTRYGWRVTTWGVEGRGVSADSWFETGLGAGARWEGRWIARDPDAVEVVDAPEEGLDAIADHGLQPTPLLRRSFDVRESAAPAADRAAPARQLTRARLYASARGLYELRINGDRVGDGELTPGWTDYAVRLQYQAYDVTELLQPGENVLAATLADGWWSGFVGFDARRRGAHYGSFPQLIAQLRIDYADGSGEWIATDDQWRTTAGPTRYADLLMGECLDATALAPGWDAPGFDDASWEPAVALGDAPGASAAPPAPAAAPASAAPPAPAPAPASAAPPAPAPQLVASLDEPVRAFETLVPRSVRRVGAATHLVDFGQNIAGRVRLTVRDLPRGRRVTIRHGEALDDDGSLYTLNLRSAEATDVLISPGGEQPFTFEPRFTFHGFRYAEVSGIERDLDPADVGAVVLHSDTPWAGAFDCSDPDLARLARCVAWGQRGNFLSVPTDCPQRDERLGWLADAQVFLPTAALNADVAAFFAKWLQDVRDAQRPDGGFSNVAPRLAGVADEGAPGWADAGVLVPWHLYRVTGDRSILSRNIEAMVAWVDFVHEHNPELIWTRRVGPHFADWVAPLSAPPTPRDLLATAYFARSAELTARACAVLGRNHDATRLHDLAHDIRAAFANTFCGDDGTLHGDTQTGYLLALAFELLPPDRARLAADRLSEHVERTGHLTTGFIGVGLLAPVLDEIGRPDLVHRLLARRERPSWLYSLDRGATTIWERWDGWSEEDGFQAPRMNSFNHYALGSVGEWLYRGLAGLDQTPASVAYRELLVRPRPRADIAHARAEHVSARGRIEVAWERGAREFALAVEVPPGASALVHLPLADGADADAVREDGLPLTGREDVELLGREPGALVCRIGSGRHRFTAPADDIAVTTGGDR